MSFSADVKEELLNIKMWDINSNLKQDEQLARLYLREAFIKSGYINDPNKKYHLEILFKNMDKVNEIVEILNNLSVKNNVTKKGNDFMVYIKEGEDISLFLALIGANNAVLRFEETRVIKEARNNINRQVNYETANLNRTIIAAVEQIEDIKYLKSIGKFNSLSDNLKEIANLRISYPDSSYEELGKMLLKPISKSGVSHRLRKISQIAKDFRG